MAEMAMLLKSEYVVSKLAKIEVFNQDYVKITRSYLEYFLRNELSKSVMVRPGRVGTIYLND